MRSTVLAFACCGLILIISQSVSAQATRIMGDGPDAGKILIGVIGDGYDVNDMAKFDDDVERLVSKGLFGDDVFADYKEAFSVYRLDVVSHQSGLSRPGIPKDTALGLTYNGVWERCWFDETPNLTNDRIKMFFGAKLYDYVIVIANDDELSGGCHPGGNRLYVSNLVEPNTISHEFGHAIANLFDEYTAPNFIAHPADQQINYNNCSNVVNRLSLVWATDLTMNIGLPTLDFPDGIEADKAVGMFEGCNYATKGLFRPMWNCRMKDPHDTVGFCTVCRRLLKEAMKNLLMKHNPPHTLFQQDFLRLELRINHEGSEILKFEHVSTTDGSNPVITPTSNFVFEFSSAGKTISVGSLGQDPFIVRSFPDLVNNRGELLAPKTSVTVVINVPISGMQDLTKQKLQLDIYEIKGDVLNNKEKLFEIDQTKLNKLKGEKLLKKSIQISTKDFNNIKLGAQIP